MSRVPESAGGALRLARGIIDYPLGRLVRPRKVQSVNTKTVKGVRVTAKPWSYGSQKRMYFSGGNQSACWDIQGQQWIRVTQEMNSSLKTAIKSAFGL